MKRKLISRFKNVIHRNIFCCGMNKECSFVVTVDRTIKSVIFMMCDLETTREEVEIFKGKGKRVELVYWKRTHKG